MKKRKGRRFGGCRQRRKRQERGEQDRKKWQVRFGVHEGAKLTELPTSYLQWLAVAKISERMLGAVLAELRGRGFPSPRGIRKARRVMGL